jgi:hypothetical protein
MTFQEACDRGPRDFGQVVLKTMEKVFKDSSVKPTVRVGTRGEPDARDRYPFYLILYTKDGRTFSFTYSAEGRLESKNEKIVEKHWGPSYSYDEIKDYVNHMILGLKK